MLVRDGAVAAVGDAAGLAAGHPDAERLGGPDSLVVPGLVDAHGHAEGVSTLQLGFPDEPFEPWMARMLALPAVDPYLTTLWHSLQLLASGVTTEVHMHFPAKGGYGPGAEAYLADLERSVAAHRDAGTRAAFAPYWGDRYTFVYDDDERFLGALPADLAAPARAMARRDAIANDVYLDAMRELARRLRDDPLVAVQLALAAPQWSSDALLDGVAGLADELGLRVHLHALESRLQRLWGDAAHGGRELAHLAERGVLTDRATVAHAVHLRAHDIELLAAVGASVAHNPASNMRLACGIAPVRRLAERGVAVAIGADDMTLADDDDMWSVVRLAHVLQRIGDDTAPPLSAAAVLGMAWDGGARVAGLEGRVGRLEPGRHADLALLDLRGVRGVYADETLPPADLVLTRAARRHVHTVVVGGRVLLRDGRPTHVDVDALAREVADAAAAAAHADPDHRALVDRLRPWIVRYAEDLTRRWGSAAPPPS